MRQASRRSWRIGQTQPVRLVFMFYRNTLQADALKLVAKKLQSSLAVEGELPEDGLAAYGDDGDDLMPTLARKIASGEEEDTVSVEYVFAAARDDGWREPTAATGAVVEVHRNGTTGNVATIEAAEAPACFGIAVRVGARPRAGAGDGRRRSLPSR